MIKRPLQLYLHIPFCIQKCAYCDFLSAQADGKTRQAYVDAVVKEIYAYGKMATEYEITTIFVGGGTPSVLDAKQMEQIFRALYQVFTVQEDAEITLEMNPGTVNSEKLRAYKYLGINRLSIGLQTVDNHELKMLGRIHTFEEFLDSYEKAREEGFTNINIDLISAIPGQTAASWEQTLERVASLGPEHISAYSLIVEEGTPFYMKYGEEKQGLPSEDEERRMYELTRERLEEYGYQRYEISNYAKDGYECRHNLGYWECREYLGIGLGASSLLNGSRYTHITNLSEYLTYSESGDGFVDLEKIEENREVLTRKAQMEEFMFLGLRKMSGISQKQFESRFGAEIESVYGKEIEKLMKEKLLTRQGDHIRLTDQGINLSNLVFIEFL